MQVERKTGLVSTLLYLGISLGLGLVFFTVTSLSGGHEPIARYGGAVWVFFLSLIITMPLVNSYFKQRSV